MVEGFAQEDHAELMIWLLLPPRPIEPCGMALRETITHSPGFGLDRLSHNHSPRLKTCVWVTMAADP